MKAIDLIPEGAMKQALLEQEESFAEEMAQSWLDGDEVARADIEMFFDDDGPRRMDEVKLKHKDGTPTASDLGRWLAEEPGDGS